MGEIFIYMLKAAFILAFLFLFFKLLMSGDTFHRFNRYALLFLPLIAFAIPLISISRDLPATATRINIDMNAMFAQIVYTKEESTISWAMILVGTYFLGIIIFTIKAIISYICLIHHIIANRSNESTLPSGTTLIISNNTKIAPFSWMHYIVLSKNDITEGMEAILAHEQAHISRLHSLDIIYADIICIIQWFNPIAWLYKSTLQDIHEYEADDEVIKSGFNAKEYQLLLIKKAVGTRLYSMTNSLNHSSIKKRITMMLCKKSNPICRMKLIYVLPLAVLSLAAFASTKADSQLQEISRVKVSDLSQNLKINSQEKVQKTTPILASNTSLKTSEDDANATKKDKGNTTTELKDAYVIVDGKNIEPNDLNKISPNDILSIDVIKGQAAIDKYGEKAKNGAIIVKLKGNTPQKNIFISTEELPKFGTEEKDLSNYIATHLIFPVSMKNIKKNVRIITQFVVKTDGSLSNIKIINTKDMKNLTTEQKNDCTAEITRLLGSMPKWEPGKTMIDGEMKYVPVTYTVPISFAVK